MITKTLLSFHKEAIRLKSIGMRSVDAWERCEQKYLELTGKRRYKNYNSFRMINWEIVKGKYPPLNK
jgi:hypothetical protein